MAILKNGINGPVIGKFGNKVAYLLNGQNIIRGIGIVNHWSDKQLANWIRTAIITDLLNPVLDFVRIGFDSVKNKYDTAYNSALSLNKKTATKGTYPNVEIDFPKVRFSQGIIPAPKNTLVKLEGNNLFFNWDPDIETSGTGKRDQVMLIAYFPEYKKAISLRSGARRMEGKEQLKLTSFTKQMVIETYMSFIADDRKNVSDSVYCGQVLWQEDKN